MQGGPIQERTNAQQLIENYEQNVQNYFYGPDEATNEFNEPDL